MMVTLTLIKKIIEARPYNNITVEKIECTNHLLRNFCKKLRGVVSDRIFNLKDRKLLEGRILRLRVGITKTVQHHKNNEHKNAAIKLLRRDILNGIYHVFGEHKNCAKYFCKGENENNEQNLIKEVSGDFLNRIYSSIYCESCKEFITGFQQQYCRAV
jgi:hypothetical protein